MVEINILTSDTLASVMEVNNDTLSGNLALAKLRFTLAMGRRAQRFDNVHCKYSSDFH